jgi:TetR/AcrR family transcriptional regulator, tetracycline repressor protein
MAAPLESGRRGRRRALTEQEFLDAALALLDEGGTDAMSLRAIATRVGVAPNAVYTYFPDKAAVVGALVERVLGEVDHGVTDGPRPWRERVEALAVELRARLSAHPGVVGLMIGGPMDGPHASALIEGLLGVLADGGLDSADAARAVHLLITYVVGSLALEVTDRYPRTAAVSVSTDQYLWGLHRVLDGIAGR